MKSAIGATLLAAAGSAMATSALIPAGISASCSTYLAKLDSSSTLSSCTGALNTATQAFASSSASASDVQTALGGVCATSVGNACSSSAIRSELSAFYQACTSELTQTPNDMVKVIYDTLYLLVPFRNAACSKDDTGAYCGASNSGSSTAHAAQKYLGTPKDSVSYPNATTWGTDNVAFLFLPKSLASSDCSPCTRQIVTSYMTWGGSSSYAPGIGASELLPSQSSIIQTVNSVCGASFLTTGAANAAGGIGNSIAGSANGAAAVKAGGSVATLALAAFAGFALF